MSFEFEKRIEEHWAMCKSVLDSKMRRLRELGDERERREAELIDRLKQHSCDAGELSELIHQKLKSLRANLQRDLVDYERDLLRKRLETNEFYGCEIERLFKERIQAEAGQFLDETTATGREFHSNLTSLFTEVHGVSNEKRYRLHGSLNELEIRYEKLRMDQILLEEKTDARLARLKMEAADQELADRKSRGEIVRLRETRNALAEETRSGFDLASSENKKLCKDITKIARSYKLLLKKHQDVRYINDAKYVRILKSNEKELEHLRMQLFSKIRNIFKLVLGREWQPPDASDVVEDGKSETGTFTKSFSIYAESTGTDSKKLQQKSRFSAPKIKKVLDLVIRQLEYLSLGGSEAHKMQQILQQIGCESVAEIDLLVSIFFAGQDEDDEELCRADGEVLDIVREFMAENLNRRITEAATGKSRSKVKDDRKMRERVAKEEEKHWDRLGNPVPSQVVEELESVLENMRGNYERLIARKRSPPALVKN